MEDEELGSPSVKTPKVLERNEKRQRTLFANTVNESPAESPTESETESPVIESPPVNTPLERDEDVAIDSSPEKSRLESLCAKLLDRVICGVDYEDLKNLLLVCKRISEAVISAKKCFISPDQQFRNFSNPMMENSELRDEENDVAAPNGPNRERHISGVLFRRQLFN